MVYANIDAYEYATSDTTNKKIVRHLEHNKILLSLSFLLVWFLLKFSVQNSEEGQEMKM